LNLIECDNSVFFIGGRKREKKDAKRKKKIVLVLTYKDVGCRSLGTYSQSACRVYACATFYLNFYNGLGLRFGTA
jgi:hypothetical protein